MGLADRDYMRRDPPRWEARHDGRYCTIATIGWTACHCDRCGPGCAGRRAGGWRLAVAGFAATGGTAWLNHRLHRGTSARPARRTPAAEAGPENPVLVGTVSRVVDGDTIKVELSSGPVEVRLDSIDTPERQPAVGYRSHDGARASRRWPRSGARCRDAGSRPATRGRGVSRRRKRQRLGGAAGRRLCVLPVGRRICGARTWRRRREPRARFLESACTSVAGAVGVATDRASANIVFLRLFAETGTNCTATIGKWLYAFLDP